MNITTFPDDFIERVINTHGELGQVWLKELPDLIEYCQSRYRLTINKAMTALSVNYTTQATTEAREQLIVKFCLPSAETYNEINALNFLRSDSMVQLLHSDNERGILVLEKLQPGLMLSTLPNDDKATRIAAQLMQKILKPAPHGNPFNFPTTQEWFERLNHPIELPITFSNHFIDNAKNIANDLHQEKNELILLHGDLHHFNILSAHQQTWLAIDPKGIIGPREYEVGALLRNPIPDIISNRDTKAVLARRIDILSEILHYDRKEIIAWGFAQAVLASVWSIDMKSQEWHLFLKCAETLFDLME